MDSMTPEPNYLPATTRPMEQIANTPLAFAKLLTNQITDLGTYEVQMTQLATRTRNGRFARSWRSV